MRRIVWLIVLLPLAACSSRASDPSRPRGTGTPPDAEVVIANGPSERECEELIGHAIALGTADLRATKPAEQLPTDVERDELAGELRTKFGPGCRTLSRELYRCAVGASSLTDLAACHPQGSFGVR